MTSYTSNYGMIELRRAIAADIQSRYGVEYDPETEIVVTMGVSEAMGSPKIKIYTSARMQKLEGQPGEFKAAIDTASGTVDVEVGAVVLATGWVALDQKYLAPMGLGKSPMVVDAATFGKMLVADQVKANRIAFVLDTTMAEKAVTEAVEGCPLEGEAPAPESGATPAAAPACGSPLCRTPPGSSVSEIRQGA